MDIVERVKNILLQPKAEWPVIEGESGDAGYLFTNYVCIVSAIPPVRSFIGMSLIGFGPFRVGIVADRFTRSSSMCWAWSAFS